MNRGVSLSYLGPFTAWVLFFFVAPLGIIAVTSFLPKGLYGGTQAGFTLQAWGDIFRPGFLTVAWHTLMLATATALFSVGLALPTAYAISRSRLKNVWLFLVIVPFWTNFLIRIYAWVAILGNNGFANHWLVTLGLSPEPLQLLYNSWAVVGVMTYTYLPYAVLPLYASMERFDDTLLEAARDLGAGPLESHVKVMLPGISGGLTAAVLFTFIPALGQYAIPQLVGGRDSFMLGNLIARELTVTRNWPLAASMSVLLTLLTTLGILAFLRINRGPSQKN